MHAVRRFARGDGRRRFLRLPARLAVVGVTARSDVAHYLPLPLALPIASVRYRKASLMGTIIPRLPGLNDGDVAFFFWGRYEF